MYTSGIWLTAGAQRPAEKDRRQGAVHMDHVEALLVGLEQSPGTPGDPDVAQEVLENPPREVHRNQPDQPAKAAAGPDLRDRQRRGHLLKHRGINI